MRAFVGLAPLVMFVTASSLCNAQAVVKQEPPAGNLPSGAVVLVDDGTCGKGKVKQVTGGNHSAMNPTPRTRKCIAK